MTGDYQYLAEAPVTCQTSLVPLSRSQFYLVVQINVNGRRSKRRRRRKERVKEEEEEEEEVDDLDDEPTHSVVLVERKEGEEDGAVESQEAEEDSPFSAEGEEEEGTKDVEL